MGGSRRKASLRGGKPTIIRREATPYLFTIHYSLFTREGIGVPRRELVSVGGSRKTPPLQRTTNGRPYNPRPLNLI